MHRPIQSERSNFFKRCVWAYYFVWLWIITSSIHNLYYFVTFKLKIFQLVQTLCLSCVRLLLDGKGDGFCVSNTFFDFLSEATRCHWDFVFLDVAMSLSALNVCKRKSTSISFEHEIGTLSKDSSKVHIVLIPSKLLFSRAHLDRRMKRWNHVALIKKHHFVGVFHEKHWWCLGVFSRCWALIWKNLSYFFQLKTISFFCFFFHEKKPKGFFYEKNQKKLIVFSWKKN